MNLSIFDDVTRDQLALEAAEGLKQIFNNNKKITCLHKELLEINLSFAAYIGESKRHLEAIKLDLAHKASSSRQVVEILSENCNHTRTTDNAEYEINFSMRKKMSTLIPSSKRNCPSHNTVNSLQENTSDITKQQQVRTFIAWYKCMIDNERENLPLYLADDILLEWFGKTIKTRKKVAGFLKYDMQCSKHDFTTVEAIEKIRGRQEIIRKEETISPSPLNSPDVQSLKSGRKRTLRCNSPEWAEGCKPDDEFSSIERKKIKISNESKERNHEYHVEGVLAPIISHKGDGVECRGIKRKYIPLTPPNRELGQGDCLPSTSGTDSEQFHEPLNAQLPKFAVECNGYVEFTRSRNSQNKDSMKWERKCKVQISFSVDSSNNEDYIIWEVRYTDDNKCRKNLLAAFEEVAEQGLNRM